LYLAALGVDPKSLKFPAGSWSHMMAARAKGRFGLDEEEENQARWMASRRGPQKGMPGAETLGGKPNAPTMAVREHKLGAPRDFAPARWREPLRKALEANLAPWRKA
jgi:hypothetical protein